MGADVDAESAFSTRLVACTCTSMIDSPCFADERILWVFVAVVADLNHTRCELKMMGTLGGLRCSRLTQLRTALQPSSLGWAPDCSAMSLIGELKERKWTLYQSVRPLVSRFAPRAA